MEIIKIAIIGVVSAVLAVLLKKERAEFSVIVSLTAGIIILLSVVGYLENVLEQLRQMAELAGLSASILKVLLKITAIGYITQFASDLCKDAGQSAIGSKIEVGGKLLIIAASLPIFTSLLEVIAELFI